MAIQGQVVYPRRQFVRAGLRGLTRIALNLVSNMHIEGRENLPQSGPLLVVANHFSFLDPVAMIAVTDWPLEFIGGTQMPGAPPAVRWIPKMWGIFPVLRGTGSRAALRRSERVLKQGGVLGVFPEAGSWAQVLRPARPGTAFLATRTGAKLLPIGFNGLPNVMPRLRKGKRADVLVRIGKPFGPYNASGSGKEHRAQLDAIGDEIMLHIADLLDPETRGHFSQDPEIRAAAAGTEIYPWDDEMESA